MKFLIFKLENPLSCSHHSMQIRAKLAKNGILGTTFDELEWVYPFRLELQKFSVAYFFFSSHFLRFHFIAKHHGIEITQIKKVEFSIKNGNQLKRSSIVINKSSTWKTQFATQNVDLCFFLCLKVFLFGWNRSFPCSGANC